MQDAIGHKLGRIDPLVVTAQARRLQARTIARSVRAAFRFLSSTHFYPFAGRPLAPRVPAGAFKSPRSYVGAG